MKKNCFMLMLAAFASASLSSAQTVRWNNIVGVITAPNVDNPVAGISAGTSPWTTTSGKARVNLLTGAVTFDVQGLVLNGGNATGTNPAAISDVVGTLVCNPGAGNQQILDTVRFPITTEGDAHFSGQFASVPAQCDGPLFLIRIGPSLPAAAGRWIDTGAVRATDGK